MLVQIQSIANKQNKQECIPVGCLPSAAVAVGGVSSRGYLPGGGVYAPLDPEADLLPRGQNS